MQNSDFRYYTREEIIEGRFILPELNKPIMDKLVKLNVLKVKKAERRKAKDAYYKKVWKISNSQDLKTLQNYEKRGFSNYHLDHIMPISYGFKNNIDPEFIGHISNLRFIPYKENMNKNDKYKHK